MLVVKGEVRWVPTAFHREVVKALNIPRRNIFYYSVEIHAGLDCSRIRGLESEREKERKEVRTYLARS